MLLALIIIASVLSVLSIFSFLLYLFVKHVLKNDISLLAKTILVLLVIQFILGMLANLFQQIPTKEPYLVFHYFGYISAHTVNATILVNFAIMFHIHIAKAKLSQLPAIVGEIGIVLAFASGITFVNAGQNNIFSFSMALGFITALLSYTNIVFSSLYTLKKE